MRYTFKKTLIWDGAKTIDKSLPSKRIKISKTKGETGARKKLPDPGLGRQWILVKVEE